MSDEEPFTVTADGIEVGRFADAEDAQNFMDVWNHAYPHEPWFELGGDFPCCASRTTGETTE